MEFESTKEFFENWEKDPKHWANNRRRIAGLFPLRGKFNKKPRITSEMHPLFEAICNDVRKLQKSELEKYIDNFAEISKIPGQKEYLLSHKKNYIENFFKL